MRGRSLGVLMWKHLIVRKRRFIHTIVELVSTIVFVLLIFSLRNFLKPPLPSSLIETNDDNMIKMKDTKTLDEKSLVSPPRFLLYTPDTKLAGTLMDEVGDSLGLRRVAALPNKTSYKNYKGYFPYSNMSEISDFVKNFYTNEALVIFEDMEGEDWPDRQSDRLTYTIRMRYRFNTYSFMSEDEEPRDHQAFGDDYDEFMLLQWAIDTSYIKLRTGQPVPQKLSLEEFPYYDNKLPGPMTLICTFLTSSGWLSLFTMFVFLISRLVNERTTGIQELIKMVGVSSNTLGVSHFLNVLPTGLMYAVGTAVVVKMSDNPLITHSSWWILFIALFLHFMTVYAMGTACSYLVKSLQYSSSISVFVYVLLGLPETLLSRHSVPRWVTQLCGILPHVPMTWLWMEVNAFEQYNTGLSFDDISTSHTSTSEPVLLGFALMVVQCALFFSVAWYLSHVCPGKYGQALPWNYLCQKQYWTKNDVMPQGFQDEDEEEPIAQDQKKFFEERPKNSDVGIKIENVSKVFPKHKALSNVSLAVYKGEITILLGHNGAGKTTLMSIITGMMSATSGSVFVNGLDSVKHRDQVRSQLGLCPQHNLFFPDLTIVEQIIFFTLLKGGSISEARQSSRVLLERLGLSEKANSKSSELSGGMKRRLQLALSLAGGASVLVLDEPTTGLDVETRREMWDLILSLRGERTVLLTTHFMEEADALGDRVAALRQGHLRCHATPMHLKKAIGTGYRLSFTTNDAPREAAITGVVTSFVREATVKEKTIYSLSYNLPSSGSSQFPELFIALEEKKSELGIKTIGVGVSTLEEVFLKLCSNTDTTMADDELDASRVEPTFNKVVGMPLYLRQFRVLFKRQFKYCLSKPISFIIFQVLLPVFIIFSFTGICNNDIESISPKQPTTKFNLDLYEPMAERKQVLLPILMIFSFTSINSNFERTSPMQPKIKLNLDLYEPMPERKVLYNFNTTGASRRALDNRYPRVKFSNVENITDAVLRTAKQSSFEYNKYLVGIELDDTDAKVLYTTVYRHAAPVALNLLTNEIASQYLPFSDGQTLTTYNYPIEGVVQYSERVKEAKTSTMCTLWAVYIVFIILATTINSASLPSRERESGSRHIHMMAGCPAALHWVCTLSFHGLVCFLFLVLGMAIAALTIEKDSTINQPIVICVMMLILTVGSLAFLALIYLVTFNFSERTTGILLVALLVIFCLISTSLVTAFAIMGREAPFYTKIFIALGTYTMPPHSMTIAAIKCISVARLNAMCNLNKERCPALFILDLEFDSAKCCGGQSQGSYIMGDKSSAGKEILILIGQFIVYMTLTVLTQKGLLSCLSDRIFNAKLRKRPSAPSGDELVRAEADYVEKKIALPTTQVDSVGVAMLVCDVHKNYFKLIGKSCYAVQGLSFSVKKGECFGLLGVNGAGKSTTFKMLTMEECPTKGQIYANGYLNNVEKGQYLRSIGYCPQFFGLDDFQTGNDNLKLLLTLRGLDQRDVANEVKTWIDIVGLGMYCDRAVSGYSGGCTRRLGAAAALCSGAPLTLLDEPTAGVDVAARRRVWSALRRALRVQRSVVITSHSMDEMETLCSRIGIMSGGVLRALGTPAELRARHAQGHAVVIKLKHAASADEVDSAKSDISSMKSNLDSHFNCTLKDEHQTMLHYHINETMRYSDLFSELEKLKKTFPALIEDYSVTETTLEEVFLSFAKDYHSNRQPESTQNAVV